MNKRRLNYLNSGFTLVELIVVMVIIAVLASLLVTNFISVNKRGRDAERKSDLQQIRTAFELYRSSEGEYPPTTVYDSDSDCNTALMDGGSVVTFMQELPCDPHTGDVYNYNRTSDYGYELSACLENDNDPAGKDDAGRSICDVWPYKIYTIFNP